MTTSLKNIQVDLFHATFNSVKITGKNGPYGDTVAKHIETQEDIFLEWAAAAAGVLRDDLSVTVMDSNIAAWRQATNEWNYNPSEPNGRYPLAASLWVHRTNVDDYTDSYRRICAIHDELGAPLPPLFVQDGGTWRPNSIEHYRSP